MNKLTRNTKNKDKKRPICACGTEMTYIQYKGYYDEYTFWICENEKCTTEDGFKPDEEYTGLYA